MEPQCAAGSGPMVQDTTGCKCRHCGTGLAQEATPATSKRSGWEVETQPSDNLVCDASDRTTIGTKDPSGLAWTAASCKAYCDAEAECMFAVYQAPPDNGQCHWQKTCSSKNHRGGEVWTWKKKFVPICMDDQRDHIDGECPAHKQMFGGCSAPTRGLEEKAAEGRARCPVTCGVCAIAVCTADQRDHSDGMCPTHKMEGRCSTADADHAVIRKRCPETCGMCMPPTCTALPCLPSCSATQNENLKGERKER